MRRVLNIICILLTSYSLQCLKIKPNNTELTFTSGSTFTLTCEDDEPVEWTFPEDDSSSSNKTIHNFDKNGTFISELTVESAHYLDTGYYTCSPNKTNAPALLNNNIYIYVQDSENLIALPLGGAPILLQVNEFGDIVIPCRPTSPEIVPKLKNFDDDEEITNMSFEPKLGFIKKSPKVKDSGFVKCEAYGNNSVYNEFIFQLIINPLITKIATPYINASNAYHPVEGSNIVLHCSVPSTSGDIIFIHWKYPDDRVQEKAVEGTQLTQTDENGNTIANYKTTTIPNITKYDQGEYVCEVTDTNSKYTERTTYYLNVFDPDSTFLNVSIIGDKLDWTANAGDKSFQWIANVTAHPRATVKWSDQNGKEIVGSPSVSSKYFVSFDGRFAKLVINRIEIRDSGKYTFTANNSFHKKHTELMLHVRDKPEITITKTLALYQLGQNYSLECIAFAYPLPRIRWYAQHCNNFPDCGNAPFDLISFENYYETVIYQHVLNSTLIFTAKESKLVRCVAENELGSSNQSSVVRITDVKDGFAVSLWPEPVVVGEEVTLTCSVSKYLYKNNITWFFTDTRSNLTVPVKQIADTQQTNETTVFSFKSVLKIAYVTKNHMGLYACRVNARSADEKESPMVKTINMNVKDIQKPIFTHTNMNGTTRNIETGKGTRFECVIHGYPKPQITWYKNGVPLIVLPNNTRITLIKSAEMLTIKFAKVEDEGIYMCVGVNKAGNLSAWDRLNLTDKPVEHEHFFIVLLCAVLTAVCATCIIWLAIRIQKERKLRKKLAETGLLHFEEGAVGSINPELGVEEQADLLPYDRRWEFPREKLKLGKQLGSGAFGVVLKAEADGIIDENTTTTVAVKMVQRGADHLYLRALATELKIMIHLGRHLNVVNLLGACTRDINKRELMVIVEYCKYGNLRDFLLKQRDNFISQIDEVTGQLDFSITDFNKNKKSGATINGVFTNNTNNSDSAATEETPIGSDGYLINTDAEPDWRSNYRGDYRNTLVRPIKTSDLVCWSFQIARGMEYLASRKVLHGDLAARNVLLADDNIVKICDFGLAKSMYNNENYKRTKNELLPVKWMALESIRDRTFSIQSDIWSFGITMWELFSLSVTPYPGIEHVETLYRKLVADYRLPKPEYATREIYDIMKDCWHARPTLRPTFHEISERLGILLEEGVRSHYTNLNEVYLKMNDDIRSSTDYLALLNPPVYSISEEPRYVNLPFRESPEPEEDIELKPMLQNAENSFGNVKPISFSNPSYADLTRSKRNMYANTTVVSVS